MAQTCRPAFGGADAAARLGRGLWPRALGHAADPRDRRDGFGLHLLRGRQRRLGDGQLRRLPPADRSLGAVPVVPAAIRI